MKLPEGAVYVDEEDIELPEGAEYVKEPEMPVLQPAKEKLPTVEELEAKRYDWLKPEYDVEILKKIWDMAEYTPDPIEERYRIGAALYNAKMLDIEPAESYEKAYEIAEGLIAEKKSMKGFMDKVAANYKYNDKMYKLSKLYLKKMYGDKSDELQKNIDSMEAETGQPSLIKLNEFNEKKSLFERAIMGATSQAPRYFHSSYRGLHYGLAGAGTTLLTLLATGVWEPTIGLITTGTAFQLGMRTGILTDLMEFSAGLTYRELSNYEDVNGNKMDSTVAKVASIAGGVFEGLLEYAQFSTFMKTWNIPKPMAQDALRRAMINTLMREKFTGILVKYGFKYGGFVAKETGQEFTQELAQVFTEETATAFNNKYKGTEFDRAKLEGIAQRCYETVIESALTMAAMGVPGLGISMVQDVAKIESKEKRIKRIEDLKKGIEKKPEIIEEETKIMPPVEKAIKKKELPILHKEGKVILPEISSEISTKLKMPEITEKEFYKEIETIAKEQTPYSPAREKLTEQIENINLKNEILLGKSTFKGFVVEAETKEINRVSRILRDRSVIEYESSLKLLNDIVDKGKINPRYFKNAEEIKTIPQWVKTKIFTKEPTAKDFDEMAPAFNMTDIELINALNDYWDIKKPSKVIKDYNNEAIRELEHDGAKYIKEEIAVQITSKKIEQVGRKGFVQGRNEWKAHIKERDATRRDKKKVNNYIKKMVKDINKVKKGLEKISTLQAAEITKLLDSYDLVKRQKKGMMSLKETRKYLENNPEAEMPDYML